MKKGIHPDYKKFLTLKVVLKDSTNVTEIKNNYYLKTFIYKVARLSQMGYYCIST